MLKIHHLYKYFLISVLLSTFIALFLKGSVIAYGPIALLMALVIAVEFSCVNKMKIKDWGAIFMWLPFALTASFTHIINPHNGQYFSSTSLSFVALPVIVLSFLRLKYYSKDFDYSGFIYKTLFYFLFFQFIVCLGQMSTYLFGFGLHVTEAYKHHYLVSGTAFNPNDLGSFVLVISYIFTTIEKNVTKKKAIIIWSLIAILLLITGSRSALFTVFIVFLYTRGLGFKAFFSYIAMFLLFFILYNALFSLIEGSVFHRMIARVENLAELLTSGIGDDGSISFRFETYGYFIENITDLGFGSGEMFNYSRFSKNAGTHLMFQAPHSLLVEIGYWLGWPGLFFFLVGSGYLFLYSKTKMLLAIVIVVSFTIPSSVLGNIIYFYLYIAAMLSNKESFIEAKEKV